MTKNFDSYQDQSGTTNIAVPPLGTAVDRYPLFGWELVATNTSVSHVDSLTVTDPNPALAPSSRAGRWVRNRLRGSGSFAVARDASNERKPSTRWSSGLGIVPAGECDGDELA
ncbi:hypothetical protein GCM10010401_10870 [Rarobacter faecitabidus]|uniref:Uncharacterized protein n=1 Tax=Rarobacter faecitabidus TaxID=13243 RepID=A0A542ZPN0_RARFA|nr:hypothetical protein [Rarobacter faecitabidus]TQL62170.1 hypothetical protein FB461_1809 [Rarobacter faecitabidus]